MDDPGHPVNDGCSLFRFTNNEQDRNRIPDTPSIYKQEQSNRNKPPTSENRNTTQPKNKTNQHRANTNARIKNKMRKNKENYEWKNDYVSITKKRHGE